MEKSIGELISRAAREAGKSINQLALEIRLSPPRLYSYVNSETEKIPATVVAAVAHATGKPINWFFTELGVEEEGEGRAGDEGERIVLQSWDDMMRDLRETAKHLKIMMEKQQQLIGETQNRLESLAEKARRNSSRPRRKKKT